MDLIECHRSILSTARGIHEPALRHRTYNFEYSAKNMKCQPVKLKIIRHWNQLLPFTGFLHQSIRVRAKD